MSALPPLRPENTPATTRSVALEANDRIVQPMAQIDDGSAIPSHGPFQSRSRPHSGALHALSTSATVRSAPICAGWIPRPCMKKGYTGVRKAEV
eukprot:3898093-Prymnesium_polylepis.1